MTPNKTGYFPTRDAPPPVRSGCGDTAPHSSRVDRLAFAPSVLGLVLQVVQKVVEREEVVVPDAPDILRGSFVDLEGNHLGRLEQLSQGRAEAVHSEERHRSPRRSPRLLSGTRLHHWTWSRGPTKESPYPYLSSYLH